MFINQIANKEIINFMKNNAPQSTLVQIAFRQIPDTKFNFDDHESDWGRKTCDVSFFNPGKSENVDVVYTFEDFACRYSDWRNITHDISQEWCEFMSEHVLDKEAYISACIENIEKQKHKLEADYQKQVSTLETRIETLKDLLPDQSEMNN